MPTALHANTYMEDRYFEIREFMGLSSVRAYSAIWAVTWVGEVANPYTMAWR